MEPQHDGLAPIENTPMHAKDKKEDDTSEDIDRESRYRDPIWCCKLIVERPYLSFGVTLAGHILFIVITAALFLSDYDIFPMVFNTLPLQITEDINFLRGQAWLNRNEGSDIIDRTASTSFSLRSSTGEQLVLYFEEKGGNVFTKTRLEAIKNAEEIFLNNTQYIDTMCQINERTNSCAPSYSILRFFDGTYQALDPIFYDPKFNNITGVLVKAGIYPQTSARLQFFLGTNSKINATENTATSEITRSVIYIGTPLKGFINSTDRKDEQDDKIEAFMISNFKKECEDLHSSGVEGMTFFYFTMPLFQQFISDQVIVDLSFAVASMGFIFCFVWFQTGSLWITGFAIFSIVTCFLCSNLIYRLILDYRYFGIFHVLTIFIILGIGADDVFVFMDTWRETSHKDYPSLAHRLSHCYRRASLAMMFTSLTTSVAFIVSATSPLLSVYSFGVFSAIVIVINYFSVIIFFPTVVIIHHLHWHNKVCCCCGNKSSTRSIQISPVPSRGEDNINHNGVFSVEKQAKRSEPTNDTVKAAITPNETRKNPIVRFFIGPYYRFVTHKVGRWFILLFFAGMIAVFGYFATQVQVNEEEIKYLPESNNFGKALDRSINSFKSNEDADQTLKVFFIWGMKPQDRSMCHHSNTTCKGDSVWDNNFDINDAQTQLALKDFCSMLRNLNADKADELKIRKNLMTGELEVDCFLDNMETFFQQETNATVMGSMVYPPQTEFSMPFNNSNMDDVLLYNQHIYNSSGIHSNFSNYFEIGMVHWLYDGFRSPKPKYDFRLYTRLLGEVPTEDMQTVQNITRYAGVKYGTKLRYAAIRVNTTIIWRKLGYIEGSPLKQKWEEFAKEKISKLPQQLQSGYQATERIWHWLKVQEVLVTNALLGIIIGIFLALPILIAATMNIFVGLLATIIICLITSNVLGVMPIAGWKLGVLESLNLVLVVGLSVDYVVHLAEGYCRSSHRDRAGRLKSQLEEVGISVISGAVTTMGSSSFMLLAKILFFNQFGLFIFATIGFSLIYSLGLFVTILGIIGPQGDFGSLKPLYRKCFPKS